MQTKDVCEQKHIPASVISTGQLRTSTTFNRVQSSKSLKNYQTLTSITGQLRTNYALIYWEYLSHFTQSKLKLKPYA
jgi:hypothetical protein